jgi:Uma2 family endonuclease
MRVTLDIPSHDLAELTSASLAEPKISLAGVTWEQYETLIATIGDRPRLRLSYLDSLLEIMTISPEHEMIEKMIARLLEIYALEADIPLYSYGSATFRREAAARGLEADESYCLETRKDTPDFAIEVVFSSGTLDKLRIYQGLGIQEVWIWQAATITVQRLRADASGYDQFSSSALLPSLDFQLLTAHILPEEEPQALQAFRQLIRNKISL